MIGAQLTRPRPVGGPCPPAYPAPSPPAACDAQQSRDGVRWRCGWRGGLDDCRSHSVCGAAADTVNAGTGFPGSVYRDGHVGRSIHD